MDSFVFYITMRIIARITLTFKINDRHVNIILSSRIVYTENPIFRIIRFQKIPTRLYIRVSYIISFATEKKKPFSNIRINAHIYNDSTFVCSTYRYHGFSLRYIEHCQKHLHTGWKSNAIRRTTRIWCTHIYT